MTTTTPTADGGSVETFVTANASDGSQTLHVQKLEAGGHPLGAEFDAVQYAPFLPVTVDALANGGFVVAYGYAFRGWNYDVSVFGADGAALKTFALTGYGQGLEITAGVDGGFLVADQATTLTADGIGYNGDPLITAYDNGGNALGPTLELSGQMPTITAETNGHYDVAWTDASGSHDLDYDPTHPPQDLSSAPQAASGEVLTGLAGGDTLTGGTGGDTVMGSTGDNYLRGGDGDDSLAGGTGFNDINGNKGDDTIVGHSDVGDWLVGGQGADVVRSHGDDNILYGNLGNDTLQGSGGGEIIRGGQGNDSITAGAHGDWLSGDRGDDTLAGGAGADVFHTFAGAGLDVVLGFDATGGDRVQLDAGTAYTVSQAGADVVIHLGAGADEMILRNMQLSSLPDGWIFTA